MSRALSRNVPCPCGSGRKFKRCCQEALDNPALLARQHSAVGSRIRSWALEHHGEQVSAAFAEIAGGREGLVLGDGDVQLIETWALSDRELPGGGTIAWRYALREDISETECDIAERIAAASLTLLRVDGVMPGRWITVYDLIRGERAGVSSHDVSLKVKLGYVLAGRLMDGPPAQTLWGPVAILDRDSGGEVSGLLDAHLRPPAPGRGGRAGDRDAGGLPRDHRNARVAHPRRQLSSARCIVSPAYGSPRGADRGEAAENTEHAGSYARSSTSRSLSARWTR